MREPAHALGCAAMGVVGVVAIAARWTAPMHEPAHALGCASMGAVGVVAVAARWTALSLR